MGTRFKSPKVWFRGLLAAVIGGGSTAASSWMGVAAAKMAGIDVPALNLNALGVIFASAALSNLFAYLAKSPLPEIVEEETAPPFKPGNPS